MIFSGDIHVFESWPRRKAPMVEASPTLLRSWIGGQLRTMRDAAGLSQADVARHFQRSQAWPGNFENARESLPVARDMADLLRLYGHPERIEFFEAKRQEIKAGKTDWWSTDVIGAAAPKWLDQLLGLETVALVVETYDAMLPNGLVQTEDTARAVIAGAVPSLAPDEVQRRAALRIARQAAWRGPRGDSPGLLVASVVDETALRKPIGGSDVHRLQLRHLADLAEAEPNITIRLLPATTGAHPSMEGSFALYRFPEVYQDPGVVYAENRHLGSYYRDTDQIAESVQDMEILTSLALPPDESADRIRALAKELYP
ncbi:helix-turn-helix domain-containing protein [Amycolatopsis thailandensis]|uniref:helix-turn-helix domain-containing protein n=1 Tax=Amycolatopsis thailandensis TaxID=589330 RepID=UPI00363F8AC3